MEALSSLVRVYIPKYFQSVPIPDSISGFGSLSAGDWVHLSTFVGGVSLVVYAARRAYLAEVRSQCNKDIKKDCPKVVNAVDIEDLGDKQVYCRCWRSSKWPMCDGSHTKHNLITGDNVGPLIIKKKDA